ncbi:MAG: aspartate kinase, partial [Acidimicrobiia bacterium]|nr:aspartate kinase [Acidimicrobiia bacterium]
VIVVVSAMGKATDNLLQLAHQVSSNPPSREMDMLLTTGERISMALLCMALHDVGVDAVSFTGSQVGIITDTVHTKAKILEVKGDRVRAAIADKKVAVVAGFQGISTAKEITTLGRGGSDTTAVALAAALDADSCEIYTDVTGVFTADPRVVPQARKIPVLQFDEMLEMAGAGSKVLALRSVEFARNHDVPIHVRSSFTWEEGTWVVGRNHERMKNALWVCHRRAAVLLHDERHDRSMLFVVEFAVSSLSDSWAHQNANDRRRTEKQ